MKSGGGCWGSDRGRVYYDAVVGEGREIRLTYFEEAVPRYNQCFCQGSVEGAVRVGYH